MVVLAWVGDKVSWYVYWMLLLLFMIDDSTAFYYVLQAQPFINAPVPTKHLNKSSFYCKLCVPTGGREL